MTPTDDINRYQHQKDEMTFTHHKLLQEFIISRGRKWMVPILTALTKFSKKSHIPSFTCLCLHQEEHILESIEVKSLFFIFEYDIGAW